LNGAPIQPKIASNNRLARLALSPGKATSNEQQTGVRQWRRVLDFGPTAVTTSPA
jgi:hypothetical protein